MAKPFVCPICGFPDLTPKGVFDKVPSQAVTRDFMPSLKAAYRRILSDDFTILSAPELKEFSIK